MYGLPVDAAAKMGGLSAVAGALNAGNLALARIAMVHLQLPDPPPLEKGLQSREEIVALAALLHRSGILNVTKDGVGGGVLKRDVSDEPRIPRGQRGGGEWTTDGASEATTSPIIPVQELVIRPAPFDEPFPYSLRPPLPFPGRPPVPLDVPGLGREGIPANPYPDRPECAEEWNEATAYCLKLFTQGLLGRGDYRGMGKTLRECIMGQVSEECGGNSTRA